jgi:hypothetical protein
LLKIAEEIQRVVYHRQKRCFSSSQHPDWLWGSLNPFSDWYRGFFPQGRGGREWSWPFSSIYCLGHEWWSYTSTPDVLMVRSVINYGKTLPLPMPRRRL